MSENRDSSMGLSNLFQGDYEEPYRFDSRRQHAFEDELSQYAYYNPERLSVVRRSAETIASAMSRQYRRSLPAKAHRHLTSGFGERVFLLPKDLVGEFYNIWVPAKQAVASKARVEIGGLHTPLGDVIVVGDYMDDHRPWQALEPGLLDRLRAGVTPQSDRVTDINPLLVRILCEEIVHSQQSDILDSDAKHVLIPLYAHELAACVGVDAAVLPTDDAFVLNGLEMRTRFAGAVNQLNFGTLTDATAGGHLLEALSHAATGLLEHGS